MEVRGATDDDAAAIADLWTVAYTDDPRGGRTTPYGPADVRVSAETGELLVVEEDGDLAGVVALRFGGVGGRQIASEGEAELSRLAVAGPYRRRGIGRSLVEACIRIATDRGASALVLWSHAHQVEAHELYLALGFERDSRRDDEAASGGPRLVFIRRI